MSRAISSTYFSWSQSNTSSVKPCRQPSGTQIKRTGRSMALSQTAASISSEMCLMLTATSERFLQPRMVGCRARAIYCSITLPPIGRRFSAGTECPMPLQLSILRRAQWASVVRRRSFCNIRMTRGNAVTSRVKDEGFTLVIVVLLNFTNKNDVVPAIILTNLAADELRDRAMKKRHPSCSFLKCDSSTLVKQARVAFAWKIEMASLPSLNGKLRGVGEMHE